MIRTETKRVDNKAICIYCTKAAKSDSSGSYHNNDYDEFWSCDCNGVIEADIAQKEIYNLEYKIRDLKNKHKGFFKNAEYEEKLKDLRDEYGKF